MTDAYLEYLEKMWEEMTVTLNEDKGQHIGLPHPYVTPTPQEGAFAYDQFYWDSYFIILGLLKTGRMALVKGMVRNLIYLQERFDIIPSRNRFYNVGISQPPFLSSMVIEIYATEKDTRWLEETHGAIEKELQTYWMHAQLPELHVIHKGLCRYCDHHINHITAEHESGWDMTSRFSEHCLDYLPIDLNALLYKYEKDLKEIYTILGNTGKAAEYEDKAARRAAKINALMWNDTAGFYFDYDYVHGKQSSFLSLAGYYPLWAGMATAEQAERMVHMLHRFVCAGGLANTQKDVLSPHRQWDYPNGWPNQQWIVIKGLLDYGYREEAKEIAVKWLRMNQKVFDKTGKFWEKYNVVACDVGLPGRYPNQTGFGWTNAVYICLADIFSVED